jgi:cholesterol oxidase
VNALDADVIVIGSGFGGSITANRLALSGHKVLVLERGPWRDSLPVRSMGIARRAPFPYGWRALTHLLRTLQIGRFRLTLNKSGMFEFLSFPGLRILATSAVGGGSTAWGGLLEPPRDPGYWRGRHPDLSPAQIEEHYDKILADMGAVPLTPQRWLPNSIWKHLPCSAEGKCRPALAQPHVAVALAQSEREAGQAIPRGGGVERRTCAFDGDSFLGSRGGAKASVDFVYLAPVLGKGATVRDMCEVTKIAPHSSAIGSGYAVHCTDLRTREKQVVRARRIVLAAGPMNTLRLLFASLGGPEGLAPMPSLGRTFGANGDLLGAWFKNGADAISSFRSPPALGAFTVAGHDAPNFGMGGLPGVETLPLPRVLKRRLARTVLIFGMGVDSGRASVSFKRGRLHVDYDSTQEPIFGVIRAAFRVLEAESGRRTWALGKPVVPHQWGGACVGASDREGVVDHNGEVHGNPGLFVADSSALPAAVGGPPSLTVAAWAHHVANRMAQTGAAAMTTRRP